MAAGIGRNFSENLHHEGLEVRIGDIQPVALFHLLEIFDEEMTTIVCTTVAGNSRALPADELAERAASIMGEDRVRVAPTMADAIEVAVALADDAGPGAGVLIAGSVIAAGQARALLVREEQS